MRSSSFLARIVVMAIVSVAIPVVAEQTLGSSEAATRADDVNAICGVDRNCRLQYLRVNGLRKRRQRIERDLAQKSVDDRRIERIRREAAPPRDGRPFGTDLWLSTSIAGNGGMVGWSFHEHLRLELHAGFTSAYSDVYSPVLGYMGNVYLNGGAVGTRLRAYWRPDELAFYGAAGPMFLFLNGSAYSPMICDDWGNCSGGMGTDLAADVHGALLAVGVEWQSRWGIRAGAEFHYYVPWYLNAWDRTSGISLASQEKQLEDAVRGRAWGFGFNLGWAW